MSTGWTLDHHGGPQALYVYLRPPNSADPLRLTCAGLGPGHHRTLRGLARGDAVPPELLRALGALTRRALAPVAPADPADSPLDTLDRPENRPQSFK